MYFFVPIFLLPSLNGYMSGSGAAVISYSGGINELQNHKKQQVNKMWKHKILVSVVAVN